METILKGNVKEKSYSVILRPYAKVFIALSGITGLFVILGWQFSIDAFVRPIPKLVAMNPITAISLIFTSVAYFLLTAQHQPLSRKVMAVVLLSVTVIMSLLRLIEFFYDIPFVVDKVLYSGKIIEDAKTNLSSRMAPNTAVNFLLITLILFFIKDRKRWVLLIQGLSILIFYTAFFSIIGHFYQVKEFYGLLVHLPMAIHTSICFFLYTLAFLFYSADQGIMKQITSYDAGGIVARILIPSALFVPTILGYLWLRLHWSKGFTLEFGMAVLAISVVVASTLLVLNVTIMINKKDRERKEAQDQLKLAYILLQSSIEGHKDVLIFSIDKAYNFLNFNRAFAQATEAVYGSKVVTGKSMLDSITNPEDREKAKLNCERAIAGESHIRIEEYGEIERSFFETRYNPIVRENGEILGITVLSSNVTERKLAEEKIITLNTELEAFSYSVAHDLRAPLVIIDGYANIILEDYGNEVDEECQRLLKVISGNANKMGNLIDDLLSFSKLGRLSVKKGNINMQQLMATILDEQLNIPENERPEIRLKNIENLKGDRSLISHVFTNLISNAIKYSSKVPKPVIEIDSTKAKEGVTYIVKDNGAGFDMKYVDKLFGVFQRLHSDSEFVGNGVGLATVKRIVNKHGGKAWAEGVLNKGATFYIFLP